MPQFVNFGTECPVAPNCDCKRTNYAALLPAKNLASYLADRPFNVSSRLKTLSRLNFVDSSIAELMRNLKYGVIIRHHNGKIQVHVTDTERPTISVAIPTRDSDTKDHIMVVYFEFEYALAFDFAYSGVYCNRPNLSKHFYCVCPDVFKTHSKFRVIKPLIQRIEADKQYNQFAEVVAPEVKFDFIEPHYVHRPTHEPYYKQFKRLMNIWLSDKTEGNWRKFGNSPYVGTHEVAPGELHLLFTAKNKLDFETCLSLAKRNGYPNFVQRFPKIGKTRSDGTTRAIYCMNVLLEVAQRSFTKMREIPQYIDGYIKGIDIPSACAEMESYDVVHCDEQLMPYIKRYVSETGRRVLLPKVLNPYTYETYFPNAFPSGTLVTSSIVQIFCTAIALELTEGPVYVQGDTIMIAHPVTSKHVRLRHSGRGVVNGFAYASGRWVYTRGQERLREPQYLRRTGTQGVTKYIIKHRSYHFLGDTDLPILPACVLTPPLPAASCRACKSLTMNGKHLADMDRSEFARTLSHVYSISDLPYLTQQLLAKHSQQPGSLRENSWGAAPYTETNTGKPLLLHRDQITWTV
jgi:hypothetical protein